MKELCFRNSKFAAILQEMDIVIIGSGNVAHRFGFSLKLNGHQIKQIVSKTPAHAQELAEKLNTEAETDIGNIYSKADVYILAVSDDAVEEVVAVLRLEDKLIVHTAGAIKMEVLEKVSDHFGVLYPLQTIRKDTLGDGKIPLLIEGNSTAALNRIKAVGNAISDNMVEMDSAQRLKMHLTATFCNNFPNFLITVCKTYCQKEDLDFNLLFPLLDETFIQMKKPLPENIQTGPAKRGDETTIQKHLELLDAHPEFKTLYQLLTENIQHFYKD